jgi:hypothetical protein
MLGGRPMQRPAQPNAIAHEHFARARDESSGRCQMRGGRKGGCPGWDRRRWFARNVSSAAIIGAGATPATADVTKLQHLRKQAGMALQAPIGLPVSSQGMPWLSQQPVIAPATDVAAADTYALTGAVPTDKATITARMKRPERMVPPSLEHFPAKWEPVRRRKCDTTKILAALSDGWLRQVK